MNDISDLLRELLDRCGNNETLDSEFQNLLQADVRLQDEYKLWCNAHGYTVRNGYRDYINELVESQDSIWDNYKEFGNEI
ncbi:hypothetical protein [Sodaliphilus sp.]|uniref:hypothetical protein n=1 Tax=Sodaliphilus sp. TaxID=2815818 RepID=UPI00388DA966